MERYFDGTEMISESPAPHMAEVPNLRLHMYNVFCKFHNHQYTFCLTLLHMTPTLHLKIAMFILYHPTC